jgi:hypothetical protein
MPPAATQNMPAILKEVSIFFVIFGKHGSGFPLNISLVI